MKNQRFTFKHNKLFRILLASMVFTLTLPLSAEIKTEQQINYASALQSIHWDTFIPNVKKEIVINNSSQSVNGNNISGKVAAITIPADRGTLDIKISSIINDRMVFAPNVLVLDENFNTSAFFGSEHFSYRQAGLMSSDALEGSIKLTPAIGQQQIYLLIYTTPEDLRGQTKMIAAAKAYASGTGHAIPNIPDPVANHSAQGVLTIDVSAQSNSNNNIIVGLPIFDKKESNAAVNLNNNFTETTSRNKISNKPILEDTANYFDEQIKNAVKAGNIDKALVLLEEAEKLGSTTARDTFVKSVEKR